MEGCLKVKLEGDLPEVTVDDVYLDIDGAVEEATVMQSESTDLTALLSTIKRERESPLPWHYGYTSDAGDQTENPSNSVTETLEKVIKTEPVDNSDCEEVDVDTPFCGKLKGQTQDKNSDNVTHSSLSFGLLNNTDYASLLTSKSSAFRNKSSSSSASANLCKLIESPQQETKNTAARKSTTRNCNSIYSRINILRKTSPRENVTEKPMTKQSTCNVNTDKNATRHVARKSTSKQSIPANTKSSTASKPKLAKKSTSKQARIQGHNFNLQSQVAKPINNDQSEKPLCSPVKLLTDSHQNLAHCAVKKSQLDTVHANDRLSVSPNKLTTIDHSQIKLISETSTTAHLGYQEKSTHVIRTMFGCIEKSSKTTDCPQCGIIIIQKSLRDHLKSVHNLELKTCVKCKLGFTDLNQYSEHYAFHLQQEENQIAGILRSPLDSISSAPLPGQSRHRLTRTQRNQLIARRRQPATLNEHPSSFDRDLNKNVRDSVPCEDSALGLSEVTTRLSETHFSLKKPHSLTSPFLQNSWSRSRKTVNNRNRTKSSLSLDPIQDRTLHEKGKTRQDDWLQEQHTLVDTQIESSHNDDLNKLTPVSFSKVEGKTDAEERRTSFSPDASYSDSSPPKRQRFEEHDASAPVTKPRWMAKVSLVSLEMASQPFNCRDCLAAFNTALTCPQSFRCYFRQQAMLSKFSSKESINSDQTESHLEQEASCSTFSVEPQPSNKQEEENDGPEIVVVADSYEKPEKESCVLEKDTATPESDNDDDGMDSIIVPSLFHEPNEPECIDSTEEGVQKSQKEEKTNEKHTFECKICSKKFIYRFLLLRHSSYHSFQFGCGFCQKAYKQKVDLFDHFEIKHNGQMKFRCKYCERKFEDLVHFETHIKIHKDGTVVRCTVCNKRYNTSKQMLMHLKSSHGPCELCGKTFTMEKQFKEHKRTAHSHTTPPKQVIVKSQNSVIAKPHNSVIAKSQICRICGRAFLTLQGLLSHKRHYHIGKKPTPLSQRLVRAKGSSQQQPACRTSPQNPLNSISERVKLKAVTKVTKSSASKSISDHSEMGNLSDKSVKVRKSASQSSLTVSIIRLPVDHLKKTKLPSVSQKKGNQNVCESRKRKLSSKFKVMKCKVCQKVFDTLKGLKMHYTICHGGISLMKGSTFMKSDLHKCPICGKSFFWRNSVLRHVRVAHKRNAVGGVVNHSKSKPHGKNPKDVCKNDQLIHCTLCQTTFTRKDTLTKHLKTLHKLTKEEIVYNLSLKGPEHSTTHHSDCSYLCKICKECFPKRKAYKLHQTNRHGNKSGFLQCRICRKIIDKNERLLHHFKKHHVGKLPFLCRRCRQEFSSSKGVLTHQCFAEDNLKNSQESDLTPSVETTDETRDPEYRYKCHKCNLGFFISQEWTKHIQSHGHDNQEDGESVTSHCEERVEDWDSDSLPSMSFSEDLDEREFSLNICDTPLEQTVSQLLMSPMFDSSPQENAHLVDDRDESSERPGLVSQLPDTLEKNQEIEDRCLEEQSKKQKLTEGDQERKEKRDFTEISVCHFGKVEYKSNQEVPADVTGKSKDENIFEIGDKTYQNDSESILQHKISAFAFEQMYENAWCAEYSGYGNNVHEEKNRLTDVTSTLLESSEPDCDTGFKCLLTDSLNDNILESKSDCEWIETHSCLSEKEQSLCEGVSQESTNISEQLDETKTDQRHDVLMNISLDSMESVLEKGNTEGDLLGFNTTDLDTVKNNRPKNNDGLEKESTSKNKSDRTAEHVLDVQKDSSEISKETTTTGNADMTLLGVDSLNHFNDTFDIGANIKFQITHRKDSTNADISSENLYHEEENVMNDPDNNKNSSLTCAHSCSPGSQTRDEMIVHADTANDLPEKPELSSSNIQHNNEKCPSVENSALENNAFHPDCVEGVVKDTQSKAACKPKELLADESVPPNLFKSGMLNYIGGLSNKLKIKEHLKQIRRNRESKDTAVKEFYPEQNAQTKMPHETMSSSKPLSGSSTKDSKRKNQTTNTMCTTEHSKDKDQTLNITRTTDNSNKNQTMNISHSTEDHKKGDQTVNVSDNKVLHQIENFVKDQLENPNNSHRELIQKPHESQSNVTEQHDSTDTVHLSKSITSVVESATLVEQTGLGHDSIESVPANSKHRNKNITSSNEGVENKQRARLNIFDVLASRDSTICQDCGKPCIGENGSPHLCSNVSNHKMNTLSTEDSAVELPETPEKKSVDEYDKAEEDGSISEPEKAGVQTATQMGEFEDYRPVGLIIRNHRSEQQDSKICPGSEGMVGTDSVFVGSGTVVQKEGLALSCENQNETTNNETFSSAPSSDGDLLFCNEKLLAETSVQKTRRTTRQSSSHGASQCGPAKEMNQTLTTRQFQGLAKSLTSRLKLRQQKPSVLKGNKNETTKCGNACETTYQDGPLVGTVVSKENSEDSRTREMVSGSCISTRSRLQRSVWDKLTVEPDRKDNGKDVEPICNIDRLEEDTLHDCETESRGESKDRHDTIIMQKNVSLDSNKEKEVRSTNIFDILSLDKLNVAETSQNMTNHAEDVLKINADYTRTSAVENNMDQNQSLSGHYGENLTESKIREQLTELILNSQEPPSETFPTDSLANLFQSESDSQCESLADMFPHERNALSEEHRNITLTGLTKGPFEDVTDCLSTDAVFLSSTRQNQNQAEGFDNCNDSGNQTCHGKDSHEEQGHSSGKPAKGMKNTFGKLLNNQMENYVKNLRKRLTLDENALPSKKVCLGLEEKSSESSVHDSHSQNLPPDLPGKNSTSVRHRRSSCNTAGGASSGSKANSRLNIFDILSEDS